MSHHTPRPSDRPAPDADAAGYDPRPHFAPTRTVYQVFHGEQPVSAEYDSMMEAELYRVFHTPATDSYRVRPVHATETPRTA